MIVLGIAPKPLCICAPRKSGFSKANSTHPDAPFTTAYISSSINTHVGTLPAPDSDPGTLTGHSSIFFPKTILLEKTIVSEGSPLQPHTRETRPTAPDRIIAQISVKSATKKRTPATIGLQSPPESPIPTGPPLPPLHKGAVSLPTCVSATYNRAIHWSANSLVSPLALHSPSD